jgi:endonuclease YncB( thermonuclease family)
VVRWSALLVAVLFAVSGHSETLQGRVVAIADGDTITVLDATKAQHKIRLAGIDAPEKKQAFGQRSKESLSDLVFNREVQVETTKRDRYGREIGKVLVGGLDANLEQVKRGMAWHYKAYQREQSLADRTAYGDAELEARHSREGLWQNPAPVAPWDFRHQLSKTSNAARSAAVE